MNHPTISKDLVKQWHQVLLDNPEKLKYLTETRGLSQQVVEKYQLGWDGQRFTIPIADTKGRWANIRRYDPKGESHEKMVSYREGYGENRLYPLDQLENEGVFICEGEWDTLLLISEGYPAITNTTGAKGWKKEWNRLFEGKYVCLASDNDRAGLERNHRLARELRNVVRDMDFLDWRGDLAIGHLEGGDVTNFLVDWQKPLTELTALGRPVSELPPLPEEEKPKSTALGKGLNLGEEKQGVCYDFFVDGIRKMGSEAQIAGPDGDSECKTLCPFHDDHEPSFSFNVKKGVFKCFGCQKEGGLQIFSEFTGVPVPEGLLGKKVKPKEVSAISDLIKKIGKGKDYLHPAQDYQKGLLWYGVLADGQILLVNSGRKIVRPDELPPDLILNDQGFDTSRFSGEGVERFLSGEKVNGYDLLIRLRDFFQRYLVIRDKRIFSLLATWVMSTYVYQIFEVFPYLSIRSPTIICGKSRLLDLLRCVCFNSTDKQTNPTDAVIFRHPVENGGTLLLDEIENLHSQQDGRYGDIISTLDSGFEKGGSVSRMEKRGNKFARVRYPTYCPRILTGIRRLAGALQSRAITIFMERRRRDEHIDSLRKMEELKVRQRERDDLYIMALDHAHLIEGVYKEAHRHPGLKLLEDRQRDLWEPLITVASICDNEREGDRISISGELIGLAQRLSKGEWDYSDVGNVAQVLKILEENLEDKQEALVTPSGLFRRFKEDPYFEWLKSTKALAQLLAPLDLVSSHYRMFETGEIKRAYKITRERLEDLSTRYGGKDDE